MYKIYKVPKKKGYRVITEPLDELKVVQEYLKLHLDTVKISDAAHGFVPGRSPLTNALPHRQQDYVLNLDIKDFFPSVTFKNLIPLLKTYSNFPSYLYEWIEHACFLDGALPQGACTSPVLSNIYFMELDVWMLDYCKHYGFNYTRYADDITISGSVLLKEDKDKIIQDISIVLKSYDLRLNRRKIKLTSYSQCQTVTGIVVNNKKLTIRGRRRKELFHNLRGTKYDSLDESTKGYLEYVKSIDPIFYEKLCNTMN